MSPVADIFPVDTTSPAIAELTRRFGFAPETAEERAIRIEHLINPTAEDWARIDAHHVPARAGDLFEYVHIKCDANADDVTRPFPYLRKGISARLIDGGKL